MVCTECYMFKQKSEIKSNIKQIKSHSKQNTYEWADDEIHIFIICLIGYSKNLNYEKNSLILLSCMK